MDVYYTINTIQANIYLKQRSRDGCGIVNSAESCLAVWIEGIYCSLQVGYFRGPFTCAYGAHSLISFHIHLIATFCRCGRRRPFRSCTPLGPVSGLFWRWAATTNSTTTVASENFHTPDNKFVYV